MQRLIPRTLLAALLVTGAALAHAGGAGLQQQSGDRAERSESMRAPPPSRHQPRDGADQRWQQMDRRERHQVQERAQEFRRMDPAERERVREARRYYQSLPPSQREELRREWRDHPRPNRPSPRDD